MKFGAFEIDLVTDGRFRLDGGAMFGVVPKALWERCCPADEQNRIPLGLTCLLIRAHGRHILVDTGLGGKWHPKQEAMFAIDRTPTLTESLTRNGVRPEDISLVINTHLHFDHCGGNTRHDGERTAVPAFPRASYVVHRGEYEDALNANERTRASYRDENFSPIGRHNQWEFVTGETELLPGVSVMPTPGHTRHHQSVRVESEGEVLLFLGDLIPTVSHLPLPYLMGYDLYPLQTMETKRWVLDRAFQEGWLLVFEHDPRVHMGRVKRDVEGKYYLEEVRA
jgi:glyoxylase-like metal-dependent hydrolase (beta-lactamase superfamily II)